VRTISDWSNTDVLDDCELGEEGGVSELAELVVVMSDDLRVLDTHSLSVVELQYLYTTSTCLVIACGMYVDRLRRRRDA
jgi:hypothetical protein